MYYIDLYPPNENKNVNAKGDLSLECAAYIVLVLQFVIYNK